MPDECQVEENTHPEKHSCDSLSDTEWYITAILLKAFKIGCGAFIQQFFMYTGQVEDSFFTVISSLYTVPDASQQLKMRRDAVSAGYEATTLSFCRCGYWITSTCLVQRYKYEDSISQHQCQIL